MRKAVFSISKAILSMATIPLWFIKLFVGVGHLPNQETGEIVEVIFRHSMLENIYDISAPIVSASIITISIIASLFSAALNFIAVKYPSNAKIHQYASIIFGASAGLFIILLIAASTVARGY